jgi:aminopeptidase
MNDEQYKNLARQFVNNAVGIGAGESVWLEYGGETALPMAKACEHRIIESGGQAYLVDRGSVEIKKILNEVANQADPQAYMQELSRQNLSKMSSMQGYIRIDDIADGERCDITPEQLLNFRSSVMKDATDHRVNKLRWLVLDAPNQAFAQACGMSNRDFDEFYYGACMANYQRMSGAVTPLVDLLVNDSHVCITGDQTNIEFSIKDIGAKPCTGKLNIPDGEAFTAPVKNSVNGKIRYVQSRYMGISVPWVEFDVRDGRIERAVTQGEELTVKLNEILDKDDGARYFGEFAIAFNPYIQHPVGSILFDEKIAGSFHLTPGQCYTDWADNGNHSAVHWDLVNIQRPEYGGGDIVIDDVLIRRDGLFVPKRLQGLNPNNF